MNYRDKKKLTVKDVTNIQNRFQFKLEEFKKMTIEELQELWRVKRHSNTDREAMIVATDYIMKQQIANVIKSENDGIEGE